MSYSKPRNKSKQSCMRANFELNPRCQGCGQILAGYRRNKKTCGDACRQMAYRKRQREAEFLRQFPLLHPKFSEAMPS